MTGIKHKNGGMFWDGTESEFWKKCFRSLHGNDGDVLKNGIGPNILNLNVQAKWK